jgi:hypothetical protein
MTPEQEPYRTPAERVEDLPRILRAMRQAVQEALLRHKLLGQPVVVWRDGKVVWLQPDEIPVEVPERPRSAD